MKTTLSIIKADVGGFPGHATVHPELLKKAEEELGAAKKAGKIKDYFVARCGDDIDLILTHDKGIDNKDVHKLAWDTFLACTEVAKKLKDIGAELEMIIKATGLSKDEIQKL